MNTLYYKGFPLAPVYGPSLEEYDTADGWHVRKWSNGYVEMSLSEGVELDPSVWTELATSMTSTGYTSKFPTYPVPLVKKIGEQVSMGIGNRALLVSHSGVTLSEQKNPLTTLDKFVFYRIGPTPSSVTKFNLYVDIAGYWK